MLNNASKYAIGLVPLGIIGAIAAMRSDRAGALILVGVAVVGAVIAFGQGRAIGADLAPFVARDATPSSTSIDPSDSPRGSIGPVIVGIAAAVGLAGGALGPYWVLAGVLAGILGSGVWAFDTFRAPGAIDDRSVRNLDDRMLGPVALPVVSFLGAITIAYCFSRVLLAVNETASWVVAIIVAGVVFAILSLVATKAPAKRVVSALVGVGVLSVAIAGGAGAASGERKFEHDGTEVPTATITAKDIAYDRKVIGLPADTKADIVFTNLDVGTFHNVAIYTEDDPGTPIFNGKPIAHGSHTYEFETPDPGTYRYVCDFHPAMTGEFRVTASSTSKESE